MRSTDLVLLGSLALATTWVGCADPFVEPSCEGPLSEVVKGSILDRDVDIESMSVKGGVSKARFVLSFPSPLTATREDAGDWLLDFGFNPLNDGAAAGAPDFELDLQEKMLGWYNKGERPEFQITSHDLGAERCQAERGELCGGFGVDVDKDGVIDRFNTNGKERYHRALSGTMVFTELRPEHWSATFEVEIDADIEEPTILGGRMSGCFDARLVDRDVGEVLHRDFSDVFAE